MIYRIKTLERSYKDRKTFKKMVESEKEKEREKQKYIYNKGRLINYLFLRHFFVTKIKPMTKRTRKGEN